MESGSRRARSSRDSSTIASSRRSGPSASSKYRSPKTERSARATAPTSVSRPADARRGVTGAIVAGGANERFGGEPKGLQRVGGVRIIDRVAAAIRAVTPHIVLVANSPDAQAWLDVPVRRDVRSERGSVVG